MMSRQANSMKSNRKHHSLRSNCLPSTTRRCTFILVNTLTHIHIYSNTATQTKQTDKTHKHTLAPVVDFSILLIRRCCFLFFQNPFPVSSFILWCFFVSLLTYTRVCVFECHRCSFALCQDKPKLMIDVEDKLVLDPLPSIIFIFLCFLGIDVHRFKNNFLDKIQ